MAATGTVATALLGLAALGCAGVRAATPPVVSEDVQSRLGRVGLAVTESLPEIDLAVPPGRLDAAAKGAAKGALLVLWAVGRAGQPGALLAIGLVPVAAVIGALIGAGEADPVENAKELERTIRSALEGADLRAMLRDAMLQGAAARTGRALALVPGAARDMPGERPPYRDRAEGDIDTVLEITMARVGLTPEVTPFLDHKSNPDFTLLVTVRTRLVSAADGAELDARTVMSGAGGSRAFAAWAHDAAADVREGLHRAARDLAETILSEVLGLSPAGGDRPGVSSRSGDPEALTGCRTISRSRGRAARGLARRRAAAPRPV